MSERHSGSAISPGWSAEPYLDWSSTAALTYRTHLHSILARKVATADPSLHLVTRERPVHIAVLQHELLNTSDALKDELSVTRKLANTTCSPCRDTQSWWSSGLGLLRRMHTRVRWFWRRTTRKLTAPEICGTKAAYLRLVLCRYSSSSQRSTSSTAGALVELSASRRC